MLPLSARNLVRWSRADEARKTLAEREAALEAARAAADAAGDGDDAPVRAGLALAEGRLQAAQAAVDRLAADPPPVYLVAVPTRAQRADLRWEVRSAGLRWPTDDELRQVAADAVRQALPEGDETREQLLATIGRLAAGADDEADRAAWDDLTARLAGSLPAWAQLLAARERFQERVPDIACAMFLRGRADPPEVFELVAGRVPDQVLDRLPQGDVQLLGWHIINVLTQVPEAAAKN